MSVPHAAPAGCRHAPLWREPAQVAHGEVADQQAACRLGHAHPRQALTVHQRKGCSRREAGAQGWGGVRWGGGPGRQCLGSVCGMCTELQHHANAQAAWHSQGCRRGHSDKRPARRPACAAKAGHVAPRERPVRQANAPPNLPACWCTCKRRRAGGDCLHVVCDQAQLGQRGVEGGVQPGGGPCKRGAWCTADAAARSAGCSFASRPAGLSSRK